MPAISVVPGTHSVIAQKVAGRDFIFNDVNGESSGTSGDTKAKCCKIASVMVAFLISVNATIVTGRTIAISEEREPGLGRHRMACSLSGTFPHGAHHPPTIFSACCRRRAGRRAVSQLTGVNRPVNHLGPSSITL